MRLADLGLFNLEQRRHRGLLNETFNILRYFSSLELASVFELSVNRMRNHGYKLWPPSYKTVLYKEFPNDKGEQPVKFPARGRREFTLSRWIQKEVGQDLSGSLSVRNHRMTLACSAFVFRF